MNPAGQLLHVVDEDAVARLADRKQGPVLVHALQGFVDAGAAALTITRHLLSTLEHTPIARFDTDVLVDHRARRPRLRYEHDRFASMDLPDIVINRVTDLSGTEFLLLTGPEPDLQWARFARETVDFIQAAGVRLTLGMHGMPWAVPHTRPVGITPHATDRRLIAGRPRWVTEIDIPGHVAALIEMKLGDAGMPAVGFTAHVPHYLTKVEFPPASVALLDAICETSGLHLPGDELRARCSEVLESIDAQVASSPETRHIVTDLQERYDALVDGHLDTEPGFVPPNVPADEIPDARHLASDVERFLQQVNSTGRQGAADGE